MKDPLILVVPGLRGSEEAHWQSWLEQNYPNTQRVSHIDFDQPILAKWALRLREEIDAATHNVILVAHSFGCLASIAALGLNDSKVAALVLVAPADPKRFNAVGLADDPKSTDLKLQSIENCITKKPLGIPGILIASSNDPWMQVSKSQEFAECWGLKFRLLDNAGHINTAAGFGPWPELLSILSKLQHKVSDMPLGDFKEVSENRKIKRKLTTLAKLRSLTRRQLLTD